MTPADVVVVGGGAAGMAAAAAAAGLGASVVLVEETARLGGKVLSHAGKREGTIGPSSAESAIRKQLFDDFGRFPDRITVHTGMQVWHIEDGRTVYLHPQGGASGPCRVRGRALILAGGAMERMIPFPGWTLPGVYGAGGLNTLVRNGILPARRFLIAGTGPLQTALACHLAKNGADIAAVITPLSFSRTLFHFFRMASAAGGYQLRSMAGYPAELIRRRIPVRFSASLAEVFGKTGVEAAAVARTDASGKPLAGTEERIPIDAVAAGYGLIPAADLTRLCGCIHDFDAACGYWKVRRGPLQETSVSGVFAAGDGAAVAGYAAAADAGRLAGIGACRYLDLIGKGRADALVRPMARGLKRAARFERALAAFSLPPPGLLASLPDRTPVCRCEEVTLGHIRQAAARGATDIHDLKRRTRLGMGSCQGRFCGRVAGDVLAQITGGAAPPEGFTPRIPARPVPLETLMEERIT